jgi:phosphotransferase system enzyme I (PtsI)
LAGALLRPNRVPKTALPVPDVVEWIQEGRMDQSRELTGIPVSSGRAVGPVARMVEPLQPPSPLPLTTSVEEAAALIRATADEVAAGLRERASRVSGQASEILEMTATVATDPALLKSARTLMAEQNLAPASAVWQAAESIASAFEARGGLMAERAVDVRDVRNRLVAHLTGTPVPGLPDHHAPHVLVAEDLSPADTATLDPSVVLAIVTAMGGPNSHTAILARDLGIPAVVGLAGQLAGIRDGDIIGVDGSHGTVRVGDVDVAEFTRPVSRVRRLDGPGRTADGHRVELLANVGDDDGAQAALRAGAEGIGLLRTESLFPDTAREPEHGLQAAAYGALFARFPGRRVVVRTLDAGADTPRRYLHHVPEPNPALGVRGYRTAARDPEVLEGQLAAIARAAAVNRADVWVMAPMVSTVAEAEEFVARAHAAGLGSAGVLVEVPSAALHAGQILARADFASIGTNDLTQYTLAADRMVGQLGTLADSWDPAVLQLVEATCRAGQLQDRPVGVSGESAADPALAVVLVGLGASSLSMAPRSLGAVGAVLGRTTRGTCERLAGLALACESAADARATVRRELPVLEELGL